MTSNEIDTLIKFLSLYNADKEYIAAIENKHSKRWIEYLEHATTEYAISGAFVWKEYDRKKEETQWCDLDEKWKKILKKEVFIEQEESITLFNRKYKVKQNYYGFYLYNPYGGNDLCFKDAGISKDENTKDKEGLFPYQKTLKDLQQIIYDMLGIKYNGYEELNHLYKHTVIKDNKMYAHVEEDCTKSKKIFTLYKPTIKNYYL